MSMVTYTATGPFTNSNPPGISAAFLNAVETFLSTGWFDSNFTNDGSTNLTANSYIAPFFKANPSGTVLNGSTAGTATLYQPERGTWKEIFIVLSGFRNTGGTVQTIALPVAFTTFVRVETGALFSIQLLVGGSAQTINVVTALAGGGGSTNGQTTISANSFGNCLAAVDTIGFTSGGSGPISSIIYLRGV